MIIDCIADLHGYQPKLPGGDLLIVAGDLTARDEIEQYMEFNEWLSAQDYKRKIVIAGNHDGYCEIGIPVETLPGQTTTCVPVLADKAVYLEDSGHEYEGLKIWGTPWTPWFHGVNPKCKAFMISESKLDRKFSLIPDDIDILVSHGPMKHMLDANMDGYACGSESLRKHVDRVKPKFFIFGHIHELGGNEMMYKHQGPNTWCVNCSYVNENYKPVFSHVRLEI